MAMTLVKKTADYRIFKRGDERYAVQDGSGKPINGEEKVNILLAESLITVSVPAAPEAEPEAEGEAEAEAEAEAPAEEATE